MPILLSKTISVKYKVFNSGRWTGNPNDDDKTQGFIIGAQQNERTYIGAHGARKYKKLKVQSEIEELIWHG